MVTCKGQGGRLTSIRLFSLYVLVGVALSRKVPTQQRNGTYSRCRFPFPFQHLRQTGTHCWSGERIGGIGGDW